MCMYSQSVFSCQHRRWGLRIKLCEEAEDFIAGKNSNDCRIRKAYPPTSRKLQCRCKKCGAMDAKINKTRKMIGSIRETVEAVQRKDEELRQRAEDTGKREASVDHSKYDESNEEGEREVERQGQNEEDGQCEKSKEETEPGSQEDQPD